MPCLAPIVEALGSLTGTEADEQLLSAHFEAFRATYERASRVLLSGLKGQGTVGTRSVWIATAGGYAKARYPYAPGVVTGREAAKRLCGQEQKAGQPKATRAARRMVAEAAARLGSFDEAAEAVRWRGLCMGRSTVRLIALEAGRRTREAVAAGRPEALRRARWRAPYWAKRVPRTLVVMVDGKAFPCAKADLKGRRGKGGVPAKGRNANVLCLGWYEWADRKGKPIFPPGSIRYEVTGEGGAALGRAAWRLAVQEGVLRAKRVQFVTDGEEELEHVYQEHFRALPNCKRTIDAMHACGYVDAIVKALEPDGAKAQVAAAAAPSGEGGLERVAAELGAESGRGREGAAARRRAQGVELPVEAAGGDGLRELRQAAPADRLGDGGSRMQTHGRGAAGRPGNALALPERAEHRRAARRPALGPDHRRVRKEG